jgi:hypothetical protein
MKIYWGRADLVMGTGTALIADAIFAELTLSLPEHVEHLTKDVENLGSVRRIGFYGE